MPTKTASEPKASLARAQITGKKPRIFIDGEAGTTGLEIRHLVEAAAGLEVRSVAPAERKDPQARLAVMREVDLVVLCLPDAAAKEAVALIESLGEGAPKIVDGSTAHRVADGWVYGFPELDKGQTTAVRQARRVTNPVAIPPAPSPSFARWSRRT
jgi:N-acetyl-gamma-glutamyl-phosphate reductase